MLVEVVVVVVACLLHFRALHNALTWVDSGIGEI